MYDLIKVKSLEDLDLNFTQKSIILSWKLKENTFNTARVSVVHDYNQQCI